MSASSSSAPGPSRPTKRPASPMEKSKPSLAKDQQPAQASTSVTQTAVANDKNRPRTLNRVPRACNACRKQKMRCEGADNPPCKRCRHAGYECLFEKPVRDVTTSEQGMERIRNLETQVTSINNTLTELVSTLRAGHSYNFQAAPPAGGGNAGGGGGGGGAANNAPPNLEAAPYSHHPPSHHLHQQPQQGQQQQAVPGSPQTAADSPTSSSGTHAQGPPSSAPTPSPRFGPEGVPGGAPPAPGAGHPAHASGQQQVAGHASGAGGAGAGGSALSPLAIDTTDVGGGRAYDQQTQGGPASSSPAVYMNGHGHPPGPVTGSPSYSYDAPHGSAPAMHGGHVVYDSRAHVYGPQSPSTTVMHHSGAGHHPADREYTGVPYSPADEGAAGPPTAYRQGPPAAGSYPPPHHHQHPQYVQQQHHHRNQPHMMGPPQGGTSLPPISTLPSPYPPPSRNNSTYQQQEQYAQSPTTVSTSRAYSSSTSTTLSSTSTYSGTPHPQSASYHQEQQAYPPQRASYAQQSSYNTTGGGQTSSQGQEYPRSRRSLMNPEDTTTSNTSPARRFIPPTLSTSYSRSSHEPRSSRATNSHRDIASSNVTSAEPSDDEDGGLPDEGLVAPFSVLRVLADLAGTAGDARPETNGGGSTSHTRSPSPDPQSSRSVHASSAGELGANGSGTAGTKRESRHQGGRRPKRRKILPNPGGQVTSTPHGQVYPDVVTVGIIGEDEARELFDIFYHGCSTFLPVFDAKVDTYEALRRRSPFCVNAICMVAAKVQNGGGPESDTYRRIVDEVQKIAMATMFSPVTRQEAVQATTIIAGWSTDGGWLSLGHAVRMAFEINMHKTWPKLLKRIRANKMSDDEEERMLVISTRTWFCLYLFEHQLSLGTGRPMILHEDESIKDSQEFLKHPLAIPDDLRLVSMVQLGVIKEHLHKDLSQAAASEASQTPDASGTSNPPDDVYSILKKHRGKFDQWTNRWDAEFAKRGEEYPDSQFQRQSLEVQRMFAELFHNAAALRGIRGQETVTDMPEEQRQLALRSIDLAKRGLEKCLRSPNYRNGLRYAVHFTHVSATFAGSFLIRLARLFPDNVDLRKVMLDVEELILALSSIPAARYARTLRFMLDRARQRNVLPARSQPGGPVDGPGSAGPPPGQTGDHLIPPQADGLPIPHAAYQQSMETDGGNHPVHHPQAPTHMMPTNGMPPPYGDPVFDTQVTGGPAIGYDQSFEAATWSFPDLSDLAMTQYGLEPFYIPPWDTESHRNLPQIW